MHSACKKCGKGTIDFIEFSYHLPCDIIHPRECHCGILYPVCAYDGIESLKKRRQHDQPRESTADD